VEGSDAEIGPYELTYPFAKEKYDETIKEIEELADEAWNEANSDEEEEENTDWLKEHNLTKEDATCKECGHITTNVEIGWEVETNKNLADFFCDECRHIWRIYIK
jgi:DNA-directed RNA polymerase subunit M/transcription elongation factor TFIIS